MTTKPSGVPAIRLPFFIWYILLFLGVAGLRLLPELQIGATPVGYDSSNAYVINFLNYHGSLFSSLTTFNLLYYVFEQAHRHGLDALRTIKATSVILYACMTMSFVLVAAELTGWRRWRLLFLGALFAVQLAALRFSWDLQRNELGLVFALLCIWSWCRFYRSRSLPWLAAAIAAAVLTAGTHQIVSFLLVCVALIAAAVSVVAAQPRRPVRLSLYVLLALFVVAAWPFIAQHVTIGDLNLWYRFVPGTPQEYRMPIALSTLIFLPFFALFALLGAVTRPRPGIILVALLLLVHSFATFFFKTEGFFLWDRWMYFLVFPICIMAVDGVDACLGFLRFKAWTYPFAYLAALALLAVPAYRFMKSSITLYDSPVDHTVFNIFPGEMVSNAFIANRTDRMASSNLGTCLDAFQSLHRGTVPVYFEEKYAGIAGYYLPKIGNYLDPGEGVPATGPYYLISYTAQADSRQHKLAGLSPECPVFDGTANP